MLFIKTDTATRINSFARPNPLGDWLLTALALFLIIISLYSLYFKDSSLFSQSLTEKAVATITQSEEVVKHKQKSLYTWKNASQGLGLFLGDKLYTHEDSRAQIEFDDGNQLTLSPLSLIEISRNKESNTLILKKGSLTASLKEGDFPLTLVLGKKTVSLSGKNSQVQISKSLDKTDITVLKGEIEIENQVVKESRISLPQESSTPLKITKLPYRLEKSWQDKRNFLKGEKLTLKWHQIDDSVSLPLFNVINLKTKKKIRQRIQSEKKKTIAFIPKESGQYQIWLESDQGTKSAILDFKVNIIPLAEILIPSDNLFEGLPLPVTINHFTYPLDISLFQKGQLLNSQSLVPSEGMGQKKILLNLALAAGEYQLLVSPSHKKEERFKSTIPFTLKKAPLLNAPLLTKLQDEYLFYGDGPHSLALKWSAQNRPYKEGVNEHYEVKINEQIREAHENQLELALSEPGEKEIAVRALQEPFKSPFSPPQKIKVTFKEGIESFPSEGLVIELEKPGQEVDFSWARAPLAHQSYQLTVSKDPQFKEEVTLLKTKDHRASVVLPQAGTYYWLVRYEDKSGRLNLGRPTRIQIKAAPPPKPLKLKERQNIKLKRIKSSFLPGRMNLLFTLFKSLVSQVHAENENNYEAQISWPKERLAKKYRLQIFKVGSNRILVEEDLSEPQYTWKEAVPGRYTYRVAIIDYWDRLGEFSNRGEINLIAPPQPKPEPLRLLSPAHRDEISGEFIEFRFENSTKEKGQIEFSHTLDFSEPLLKIPLAEGATQIKIRSRPLAQKLQKKSTYWRIKGPKHKSKRRRISFNLPPKRESTQRELAFGQFEFIQRTSQTSYSQENPNATINASGFTALHLGLSWKGTPIDIPLMVTMEIAMAQAFNENDYSQMKAQFLYEFYTTLFSRRLTTRYGVEYQRQTLFNELPSSSFSTTEAGIFFLASDHQLDINKKSSLNLNLSLGQGLAMGMNYRYSLFSWASMDFDLSLFFDYLKVTATTPLFDKEVSRSQIGLSWFLIF